MYGGRSASAAAESATATSESPRARGKKRAHDCADPTSFTELPSAAQIPCILYLDSLNGSKERALNLIRDYLLHEHRAKVLEQPVPLRRASPGAASSAAAQPEAVDLDSDEGEEDEEGEPLGAKGWEELQAETKSVRTANVCVPSSTTTLTAACSSSSTKQPTAPRRWRPAPSTR